MIEELTHGVRRQERVDHHLAEFNSLPERGDAIAELVVVR